MTQSRRFTQGHQLALFVMFAVGFGFSAPVLLADESSSAYFARTDTNSDGAISSEEYRHRMVEVFYAADADRNGVLQAEELSVSSADFASADSNGNQKIELREFLNRRMRDFRVADQDGDGLLSEAEVAAAAPY